MSQRAMFSILVVALNPGEKLIATLASIFGQTFEDYQVIVKDGGSTDGSQERLRAFLENRQGADRVELVSERDAGIYDGMNQAVAHAAGEYLYFLNCGDLFAEATVLERVAEAILTDRRQGREAGLYYGDIRDELRGEVVASNPHIDAFACYRHVPCHQACIYSAGLFDGRGYDTKYRVRADYEHFLWCYFEARTAIRYLPVTLAAYEGGGFSETQENRRRSAGEHREITRRYMSAGQRFRYRLILLLTLAPLRTKMAESPRFSHFYQSCKGLLYGAGKKKGM